MSPLTAQLINSDHHFFNEMSSDKPLPLVYAIWNRQGLVVGYITLSVENDDENTEWIVTKTPDITDDITRRLIDELEEIGMGPEITNIELHSKVKHEHQ